MIAKERIKRYLYDLSTPSARRFEILILVFNLVFCFLFVAETYPLSENFRVFFWNCEIVLAVLFLLEILLRVYIAEVKLNYFFSIANFIDLLAIVPTFIILFQNAFAIVLFLPIIRMTRVVKVFRFLRFTRFVVSPQFFFGTIKIEVLRTIRLILTVLMIFFVSSGFFYHFEKDINEQVGNFGDAFYYSVVTLTTVGFGDIIPQSGGGRFVTVIMIISGIILIPWQAGQIVKEWSKANKKQATCGQCGLKYHDQDASHCKACGHLIYQEFDG
ncbi:MAG: ion transporter [Spirochaetes bacterium]|nr:ion transporter [Spirochaetota bacterium]